MSWPMRIVLVFIIVFCFLSRMSYGGEYHRGKFPHWEDLNGNGLDTRAEALIEQAAFGDFVEVYISENRVLMGAWVCPYTGEVFTDPASLDADHIVPLKWAWKHGADKWDRRTRLLFANDPFNILVVDASANRSKGARGPDEWLPANLAFAGYYILKFMQICEKYDLKYPKKEYQDLYVKVTMHKIGLKLYKLDCE